MAAQTLMRAVALLAIVFGALCALACENEDADGVERAPVRIAGETFRLELALDDATRTRGLGGRDEIPERGGMLFVFPQTEVLSFVMRDCPIPIDIAFLDGAGRIVAMHEMQPEPPRRSGESDWDY